MKNRLIPELGTTKLANINKMQLQSFINMLHEEKQLAPATVKRVQYILRKCLSFAVENELIKKNPAEGLTLPKMVKVSDITVWDKSEVEEFLKVAIEDRNYIVFLLALTTGMRKGEILGQRWKDINLKGKYLTIHQTLKNDGTGFLKTPKTKSSRRRVHLSDNVVRALEKQKTRIGREKEEMKDSYTNNDLVACSIYGTPVNPANLREALIG